MSAPIRAVVFDVDGVLVHVKFPTVLPSTLGISADVADQFFQGPFTDCLLGAKDLRELIPPYLARWGWKGGVDEFLRFWFEVESDVNYPGLAFADRVRATGRRCFLASTQERHRAHHLQQLLGVGRHFDAAFFSCELGCQKPSREFYAVATEVIGCDPGEIFLIDDKEANILGGRDMGWNGAVFRIGDAFDAIGHSIGLEQHVA